MTVCVDSARGRRPGRQDDLVMTTVLGPGSAGLSATGLSVAGLVPTTVLGLPLHPLVVHAVVVLLPLAALGAVAVAARPGWNRAYAPLVALAALAGAASATVAKLAGDQLEQALFLSEDVRALVADHGRFGLYTVVAAWPFAALAVATALLGRRGSAGRSGVPRAAAVASAVAGLVALALTVLAGHSGSTAVWSPLDL